LVSASNTLNLIGCHLLPLLAVPNSANATCGWKGGTGFVGMEVDNRELVSPILFNELVMGLTGFTESMLGTIGFKGLIVGP